MLPRGPFDGSKHPRGWHGRFSNGAGRSPGAHAMRGRSAPRPPEVKRLHAVVPVKRPMLRAGTPGVGTGGGLGAGSSGFGRMVWD